MQKRSTIIAVLAGLAAIVLSLLAFKTKADISPAYLNAELSVEKRVDDLMKRMTLEDKVAQMCQYVGLEHMKEAENDLSEEEMQKSDAQGFYPGLFSKDVAKMASEGKIGSFLHVVTAEEANHLQELAQKSPLKIPLLIGIDAIHGNGLYHGATIYPSPITMAASWNDSLVEEMSRQTAREMRATGSHWAFTPNIDVLRDPRWGRTGETFGEDPVLVGNMGVATVRGMQGSDFSQPDQVIACIKHLVAGSQSVNGLNSAPTDVSERTLMEIFLPPYRRAIQEANAFSIMAAHNEVNGVPCHMDRWLMTELMREQWGFEGFIVSDWNDVSRIASLHHVAEDFRHASQLSVAAGLDMHMHGPFFAEYMVDLVNNGELAKERVEEACRKILEAKFRLGLFENPFVKTDRIDDVVFIEKHQETALEAACQSITLLKNNGVLPLSAGSGKLLVLGPNADNMTTLGDWASPQPEERLITVYEGIAEMGQEKGYSVSKVDIHRHSKQITDEQINNAAKAAQNADKVVLVLGENSFRHEWPQKTTGENIDRASLGLSGRQMELAKAVLQSGKPVIVIYVSGSPVAEPWLDQQAKAVLYAWEPGSFGGTAIAKVLFGEVNPSGKLPLTVPRSVGQIQMVYNHKPSTYKHRYHTEKKKPLYPFGYGLSYTRFDFSEPSLSSENLSKGKEVTLSVNVKNSGSKAGTEVVQLYIRDELSSVTRPVKELKAYRRISLKPGESKTVLFNIKPDMLAFYDINMDYIVEPGNFRLMTGNSSRDKDLKPVKLSVNERIEF